MPILSGYQALPLSGGSACAYQPWYKIGHRWLDDDILMPADDAHPPITLSGSRLLGTLVQPPLPARAAIPERPTSGFQVQALTAASTAAPLLKSFGTVLGSAKLCSGCTNSFSADMLVATQEGATPIGAIRVGDRVDTYDAATGLI